MNTIELEIAMDPVTFWLEPEGQPFQLRSGDVLAIEQTDEAKGHPTMEIKQGPEGLWITFWPQPGGKVLLNGQRIWLCGERY